MHPLDSGLTEAEQGEAVKAAEALREQQGGSDDDADDYRKASKVGWCFFQGGFERESSMLSD